MLEVGDEGQGHYSCIKVEHSPPEVVVKESQVSHNHAYSALNAHYHQSRESDVSRHYIDQCCCVCSQSLIETVAVAVDGEPNEGSPDYYVQCFQDVAQLGSLSLCLPFQLFLGPRLLLLRLFVSVLLDCLFLRRVAVRWLFVLDQSFS